MSSDDDALFPRAALERAERKRSFADVPLDDVRAFWNARPCNLRHGTAPLGSREYFAQVEARKYRVEPHIRPFADFARWRDKRVLEIGCGLGTESVNFARAGAHLLAIDLSPRSVELAQQRLAVFGLTEHATAIVGDVEQLDAVLAAHYGGEERVPKFDLVFAFGVIHHTPHPERAVAQIARVLDAGGELRIMVYARYSYKLFMIMRETAVWNFGRVDELLGEYSEAQNGCPVTYSYTDESIRRGLLGDTAVWDVLSVTKDHIFPYDIAAYREHRYELAAEFRDMSRDDFRAMERELGWHLLVKAKRR